MSTLEAIGVTAKAGSAAGAVCFIAYGLAIRCRSTVIAPRCIARPKDTIYAPEPKDKCQERGTAMFGWVMWTLSLSYDTMLRGVPGTGTRKNGLSGKMLNLTLDEVVMLRFHSLCLRVALLGTFLCMVIVLPMNLTANCFEAGVGLLHISECVDPTENSVHLSSFERTTVANIPPLVRGGREDLNLSFNVFRESIWWGKQYAPILGRLYGIVLCSWVVYCYACYLLKEEWKDVLALRRVYYLENDVWRRRRRELKDLACMSDEEDGDSEDEDVPGEVENRRRDKRRKREAKERDPWIPDPEDRETVPNIELYSVLVGHIPEMPSDVSAIEEAIGKVPKDALDWEMELVCTFFNQCIPPQPGYSSSVAAVTILPSAQDMARAWRRWYEAASTMQRLKYIRSVIEERRESTEGSRSDEEYGNKREEHCMQPPNGKGENGFSATNTPLQSSGPHAAWEVHEARRMTAIEEGKEDDTDDEEAGLRASMSVGVECSRHLFGFRDNLEVERQLFVARNYGPEQRAVYARELANAASGCCPNGCCAGKIRTWELDELIEREEEALMQVFEAHEGLVNARAKATENVADADNPTLSNHAERKDEPENDIGSTSNFVDLGDLPSSVNTHPSTHPAGLESSMESLQPNGGQSAQSLASSGLGASDASHLTASDRSNSTTVGKSSFNSKRQLNPQSLAKINSEGQFVLRKSGSTINSEQTNHPRIDAYPNASDLRPTAVSLTVTTNPGGLTRRRQSKRTEIPDEREGSEQDVINRWEQVEKIRRYQKPQTMEIDGNGASPDVVANGVWKIPTVEDAKPASFSDTWRRSLARFNRFRQFLFKKVQREIKKLHEHHKFAVVTFTSRQAAVAVRQCLNDGRGENSWMTVEKIPVPPLADAAEWDFITCRGCCRPVTLTLNKNRQLMRKIIAVILRALIYVFWTVPLTLVASATDVSNIIRIFPQLLDNPTLLNRVAQLTGAIPAAFQNLALTLVPMLFLSIANSGSNAVSLAETDSAALRYYWWFMVFTAFTGTSIATMALSGLTNGTSEIEIDAVLIDIANSIPTQIGSLWTNTLLLRALASFPAFYMLQITSFIYDFLRLDYCRRLDQGGGPGADIPYRIYVDTGVAFMCVVALSFASPLVAPCAALSLLVSVPVLRRNCIYLYRPSYDGGGFRWPFLFQICISSMYLGQLLLAIIVFLKGAVGPAIFAIAPMVPTAVFSFKCKKRFGRSYDDSGLLQASLLDNVDVQEMKTPEDREEFRRFLVDAHKAAYIPVCLAGEVTSILTKEPAEVVSAFHESS